MLTHKPHADVIVLISFT